MHFPPDKIAFPEATMVEIITRVQTYVESNWRDEMATGYMRFREAAAYVYEAQVQLEETGQTFDPEELRKRAEKVAREHLGPPRTLATLPG